MHACMHAWIDVLHGPLAPTRSLSAFNAHLLRLSLAPGEHITSVYVCGSADSGSGGGHAATFYLRFTTDLNGVAGGQDFGLSGGNPSVGCTTSSGYPYNGYNTATGTTTGGQLIYLSGSDPGSGLAALCFQWNTYP